jgi:nitrate reductase NapE component
MNEENIEQPVVAQKKIKKSHRKLKVFGIIILSIFILVILVIGWFGFIPGLSDLMGANKPRDLGVKYTTADYESYKKKAAASFLDISSAPDKPGAPGEKLLFEGPVTTDNLQLTQEEITATVNEIGWVWMPISNAQIRISQNTVEVSGNLNLKYMNEFVDFIGGVGYSKSDVATAVSWAQKFTSHPPIYLKASASVQDDQLSLDVKDISVGRLGVPVDIAEKVLFNGTSNAIYKTDNLEARSATLENDGQLKFSGIYPSIVYVRR